MAMYGGGYPVNSIGQTVAASGSMEAEDLASDKIGNEIARLIEQARQLNTRIENLGNRLFGAVPTPCESTKDAIRPDGTINLALGGLEILRNDLYRVSDALCRLERL